MSGNVSRHESFVVSALEVQTLWAFITPILELVTALIMVIYILYTNGTNRAKTLFCGRLFSLPPWSFAHYEELNHKKN